MDTIRNVAMMLMVVFVLFFSCNDKTPMGKKADKEVMANKNKLKPQLPCVVMYSYGAVSNSRTDYLAKELRKYYPSVRLTSQHLPLPKKYCHRERNRYNAPGLLTDLERLKKGTVVLGVTDEVIYHANEKSPTFGIFGISTVGSHVALISLRKPSGRRHTDNHVVKLMLHELGHAFGLDHCKDQHCFMVDAEHGNKFSQTPSFCKHCKRILIKSGWKL